MFGFDAAEGKPQRVEGDVCGRGRFLQRSAVPYIPFRKRHDRQRPYWQAEDSIIAVVLYFRQFRVFIWRTASISTVSVAPAEERGE